MYVRGIYELMYSVTVLTNKFENLCVFGRFIRVYYKFQNGTFLEISPWKPPCYWDLHFFQSYKIFIQKIFCKEISVSKFQKHKKYHFLAFSKIANHASTVASRENCGKCSHLEICNLLSWISQEQSKCNIFVNKLRRYIPINGSA